MNDLQKIDKKIKDSSNNISAMCKFIKYANVVSPTIFAVLVLVLTFNYNLLDIPFVKTHPIIAKIIFILIIAFCAFMIIISILYFFVSKEEDIFIGELNEKRNLLTKNQELISIQQELNLILDENLSKVKELDVFMSYIRSLFPVIITNILHCEDNNTDFYEKIKPLFLMLYDRLPYIYTQDNVQIFTMALYLYDENEKSKFVLKPYYSKKPVILGKGRGRWWKVGDGQIGLAYSNETSYNYKNIKNEINPQTLNSKPDDEIRYVSALSFPIYTLDKRVRGVFCITSNAESAFINENSEYDVAIFKAKESCAKIVANIIELCFNERFKNSLSEPFEKLPQEEKDNIELERPLDENATL